MQQDWKQAARALKTDSRDLEGAGEGVGVPVGSLGKGEKRAGETWKGQKRAEDLLMPNSRNVMDAQED
jgi:hypothetical protein